MIPAPRRALPFYELVLLLAALMSLMAFSIDSIIPSLPEIARDLNLVSPTRAQLVIGAFILGTGVGQIVAGPFSDSFGRRPALTIGIAIFIAAAFGARSAQSFEALLAFRFLQGLGASAPRVISVAVTRDLFSGRAQARVGSLIFMFFVVVPAFAPLLGQQIIAAFGWRAMFTTYMLAGAAVLAWFLIRQPETLAPEARRPFRPGSILRAMREVVSHPVTMRYLVVMSLGFGQLIAYIAACQQIFTVALETGDRFTLYFALIALLSAVSGFINARLVMRLGMRKLASFAFGSQVLLAVVFWVLWASGTLDAFPVAVRLWVFILWSITLFFMNGLTFGNLNALAMEPMGHIAGTAGAVIGAVSTLLGVAIAMPIGMAFDGTPLPLVLGVAVCSTVAFVLIWSDRKRDRAAMLASG